ncbi:MAG: APC family permease [Conexivisphaerales archaeon]
MDEASSQPKLKKAITLKYAVALYVSSVLGSGILVIPGLAAKIAGASSILAWLLLALLSYPFAYTFASLSSRRPESGGVYAFAKEGLGKLPANAAAWLFSTWYITGAPAATLIGTLYLDYTFHIGKFLVFALAAMLIFISFIINYLGITLTGRVQLVVTVCIVGLMAIATAVSAPQIRVENLEFSQPLNLASMGTASALVIWSYFGYENVSNVAEEFENPKRDFQRSVALSVLTSSSLYIATAIAIVGTGSYNSGNGIAPFAAILSNSFGVYAGVSTSLLALFIVFGNMNAYTTGISRVVYAASKDGFLPARLSRVNSKYRTPDAALATICFGAIIMLVAYYVFDLTLQEALFLTNGIGICVYIIGSASGIKLLKERGVRRLYPWLSLLLSITLVAFVGTYSLAVIACVILLSFLYARFKAAEDSE